MEPTIIVEQNLKTEVTEETPLHPSAYFFNVVTCDGTNQWFNSKPHKRCYRNLVVEGNAVVRFCQTCENKVTMDEGYPLVVVDCGEK